MLAAVKALFWLPIAAGLLLMPRSGAAAPARYWVIVNASNPVTALKKIDLSRLFLKKTTTWPNQQPVFPVDLGDGTPARQAFSTSIHKKSVRAVKSYWQQRIFSGSDVPPPELGSDAEVTAYVKTHPNAVGYLGERPADAGVKLIKIIEK